MGIEEIDEWVELKDELSDKQKENLANTIINNKKAMEMVIKGAAQLKRLRLLSKCKD